jgi:hypothetical protein
MVRPVITAAVALAACARGQVTVIPRADRDARAKTWLGCYELQSAGPAPLFTVPRRIRLMRDAVRAGWSNQIGWRMERLVADSAYSNESLYWRLRSDSLELRREWSTLSATVRLAPASSGFTGSGTYRSDVSGDISDPRWPVTARRIDCRHR